MKSCLSCQRLNDKCRMPGRLHGYSLRILLLFTRDQLLLQEFTGFAPGGESILLL